MRAASAVLCLCLLVGIAASSAAQEDFAVLVRLGLKDAQATDWSGSAKISAGEIREVRGWRFAQEDKLTAPDAWQVKTDAVSFRGRTSVYPNGIVILGSATETARITVRTPSGPFDFSLADIPFGAVATGLSGAVSAERVPAARTLTSTERQDDYPAACAGPNGVVWAVWQSYADLADQLYFARLQGGAWSAPAPIPGVEGQVFGPTCAADADGSLWVVWSQLDEDRDWDLYGSRFDGKAWSQPEAVTSAEGNDIHPALVATPGGGLCLAWQAYRGGQSDIMLAFRRGGKWTAPVAIADSPANEWMPAVACDAEGALTVAWDTYRNGSYDIYMRQVRAGKPQPEVPVATSPDFEAKATVACDGDGRVWIAWEHSGPRWGKDSGSTVPREQRGLAIYRSRDVRVAVYDGGKLSAPAAGPETAMPERQRQWTESPRLVADGAGRAWLLFRQPVIRRRPRGTRIWGEKAWENHATYYDGDRWLPAVYFPNTLARIDTMPAAAALPTGLAVVWHTDGKEWRRPRMPVANKVFAATILAPGARKAPQLAAMPAPALPEDRGEREAAQVRRIRAYRTDVSGRPMRILRGDLHRHTEISWDGNGDGSIEDTFRYAIDAAALDFLEVTDHNQTGGPDEEYVWWRTQKISQAYSHPPTFISLFGYERSRGWPNGHRNVIDPRPGIRTFPFTPPEGDTKRLYDYCRKYESIIISHTSATRMGTDWRDNDPFLEPVVEIFQGARTSYEYEGAPRSAQPGSRAAKGSGYEPEGFVWRAWEKGLRLGIIASSDHGSTHISYANIYAPKLNAQALVNGLRARHTYGATDNIIVSVHAGERFQGDEFKSTEAPRLHIEVVGTGELSEVAIIKNLKFVYTTDPDGAEFATDWRDEDFGGGTSMYYVRAQQADGQIAWASPLWITQ